MIFFCFSKQSGFGAFLVHPTVVLVLLSAAVKRCFVSRMRDFFIACYQNGTKFYVLFEITFCVETLKIHLERQYLKGKIK